MLDVGNLLYEYATEPISNYEMENFSVTNTEGNPLCGDGINVFLEIDKNGIIKKFSFTGDTSFVTTAAVSILAEVIEGMSADELLTWDYDNMKDLGVEVSERRKRSAVLGLLATRNAIHKYRQDDKKDDFDSLLDE